MIFANKFEEAAYKERIYFNNLRKIYNLFPDESWIVDATPYVSHDRYDYLIMSKTTSKRYIVEIKIRSEVYPDGYVYEKHKHKSLLKAQMLDPTNNEILYINSTPSGTYVWNITKLFNGDGKYKLTNIKMNKATMSIQEPIKVDKETYLLQTEDATHYEFKYDQKQFNEVIEGIKLAERRLLDTKMADKVTIESILFGKD